VPLQFLHEHRMKKPHRPQHQIRIRTAVEFSFAIEVTLSDSEISSPDARQKSLLNLSPCFPLFEPKMMLPTNGPQHKQLTKQEIDFRGLYLLKIVIVLVSILKVSEHS